MATHSSTLAWKLPWTEEPGRLQSMGSLRVGHNGETSLSLFLSCTGEGNGNPLQCSCLENPRDGEPGGLPSMGLHRVGHDWSDLAAAACVCEMCFMQFKENSMLQSVQFSCSVMFDSLQPHGLQPTRLPCASPTPGACSNSHPLSQWCHATTNSM